MKQKIETIVLTKAFHNQLKLPSPALFSYHTELAKNMFDIQSRGAKLSIPIIVSNGGVENELHNFFYDFDVDTSPEYYGEIIEQLKDLRFQEVVKLGLEKVEGYNNTKQFDKLLGITEQMKRAYDLIFGETTTETLVDIARKINNTKIIPFSISALNELIGGWTMGYPNVVIARGSHAKSTLMTQETLFKVDTKIVKKALVILTEEEASSFWRRVFSAKCKLKMNALRYNLVKVTEEHISFIEKRYGDKIEVFNDNKFDAISRKLSTTDADFIYIDHVNGIEFAKGSLKDMFNYFPKLLAVEKVVLRKRPNTILVNVAQVTEKSIDNHLLWKMPRLENIYGGTVLTQPAREVLSLYYPYKDVVKNPSKYVGKLQSKPHGKNDFYISVEKSNLGDTGEVRVCFDGDYATFTDTVVNPDKKIDVDLDNLKLEL